MDMTGLADTHRRHLRRLLAATSLGIALAALYLAFAPPAYTSRTILYVDPGTARVPKDQAAVPPSSAADLAIVDSQVAIIASEAMMGRVVETLSLGEDPEFAARGFATWFREAILGSAAPPASEQARAAAVLARRIDVTREAGTYIVSIEASAASPAKAAQIADTLASLYLADQTESRTEEQRRAGSLIKDRIAELRADVRSAEARADDFKRRNRLTGDGAAATDKERIAKLNADLAAARSAAAETQARLEAVRSATASADLDALPQAIRSATIERLRTQLSAVAGNEAALAAQLKSRHPVLVEARSQLAEVQAQIRAELKRIAGALAIEHDVAGRREAALARSIEAETAQMARAETAEIKLRELEQEASASRDVLAKFLERAKETESREAMAVPFARVVSPATVPVSPGWPAGLAVLALGAVGGLSAGLVHARLRERAPKDCVPPGFTPQDELPAFALPPLVHARHDTARSEAGAALLAASEPQGPRENAFRQAVLRLLATLDQERHQNYPLALVIVDASAEAGAAAVALALAETAAAAGDRVLVVDANSSARTLSSLLAPDSRATWATLLAKPEAIRTHMSHAADANVSFLPLAPVDLARLKRTERRQLAANLAAAALDFDLVIVEAGALANDEAASALLPLADRLAVVARTGVTPRRELEETLRILAPLSDKLSALVLAASHGRLS